MGVGGGSRERLAVNAATGRRDAGHNLNPSFCRIMRALTSDRCSIDEFADSVCPDCSHGQADSAWTDRRPLGSFIGAWSANDGDRRGAIALISGKRLE